VGVARGECDDDAVDTGFGEQAGQRPGQQWTVEQRRILLWARRVEA